MCMCVCMYERVHIRIRVGKDIEDCPKEFGSQRILGYHKIASLKAAVKESKHALSESVAKSTEPDGLIMCNSFFL